MWYEIVYETGNYSTAFYDSEEEAKAAAKAHHTRAEKGQLGGPTGNPAERIVKVLEYDRPPGDSEATLSVDVAKSEVAAALKTATHGSVVDLLELAALIRDLSNPLVESGPHESNFRAQEVKELAWQ